MKAKQITAKHSETKKALVHMKHVLLSLVVLLMISCGDDGQTADEATSTGWDNFQSGNLENAITNFEEAIDIDNSFVEAYVGLSFAYALNNQLNAAALSAQSGLDVDDQEADLHAVLGLVNNALGSFASSNESIEDALDLEADWTFGQGLGMTKQSLEITAAQNFVNLRNYAQALAWLQKISPNFNPDLNTTDGLALLLTEIENRNRTLRIF
jgi:tetratricopeptide (TPR) repeat protein